MVPCKGVHWEAEVEWGQASFRGQGLSNRRSSNGLYAAKKDLTSNRLGPIPMRNIRHRLRARVPKRNSPRIRGGDPSEGIEGQQPMGDICAKLGRRRVLQSSGPPAQS